jgi:hypothetical protein
MIIGKILEKDESDLGFGTVGVNTRQAIRDMDFEIGILKESMKDDLGDSDKAYVLAVCAAKVLGESIMKLVVHGGNVTMSESLAGAMKIATKQALDEYEIPHRARFDNAAAILVNSFKKGIENCVRSLKDA